MQGTQNLLVCKKNNQLDHEKFFTDFGRFFEQQTCPQYYFYRFLFH